MPAKSGSRTSSYPDPFVIAASAEHKQTMILLHGRGSDGEKFGLELLKGPISRVGSGGHSFSTVQTTFPHMKFIFPTAKKRRARWYNRAVINQWFDGVPIDKQDHHNMSREQEEWQLEGLRESTQFLDAMVEDEVKLVGSKNVIIGGLSQGCAASLHLLLSYEGGSGDQGSRKPLGGFVGMSGWLPFAKDVRLILNPEDSSDDDDDPFGASGSRSDASTAVQVCNFIRDNMDLPALPDEHQPLFLATPVFLGHGIHDSKVKVAKGQQVAEILKTIGVPNVTWKEYDEGHWYKVPEELDDIVDSLQKWLHGPDMMPQFN
ncbi:hypothetical protein M409DRAFT_50444 [Zasmidium cellare ATCC 36951]|uniref:Phospholipase/carboxylesterase/thioesterase domain-containing protein n=1 Tax=Zasmidium cellare ATCC 36951 TaxID=1080233 RepID=A0A6A6CXB8_ZASCE|nr:uncharacterized protein M409DRAFT_50444 [Zasmidium cellare ATCC 36951]KAF2171804.1 hypothetical protein M409DRAFT_50444 [Zasmidium cellare ATCC 36951]